MALRSGVGFTFESGPITAKQGMRSPLLADNIDAIPLHSAHTNIKLQFVEKFSSRR